MYVIYKLIGGVNYFACGHGWSPAWGDAQRFEDFGAACRLARLTGSVVVNG
jgi:hypothetical protein